MSSEPRPRHVSHAAQTRVGNVCVMICSDFPCQTHQKLWQHIKKPLVVSVRAERDGRLGNFVLLARDQNNNKIYYHSARNSALFFQLTL